MTEADLLRRVCLAPADDLPRLLYADWCDEQGQVERAEFIRCQCRLHPYRSMGDLRAAVEFGSPREYAALRRREMDLLYTDKRACRWSGGLYEMLQTPTTGVDIDHINGRLRLTGNACLNYVRGFIDRIECTAAQWLTHGPAIVRQQPITRVVLSDREPAQISDNGRQYYYWLSPSNNVGVVVEYIPGCTYKWLKRGERNRFRWESPQAAKTALSDAALLWARHEAGLEVTS